jgi:hypothetical protein
MWLLTCDGPIFDHKPIWLRPGAVNALGRTSGRAAGNVVPRHIDHKSVSRKHLSIQVGNVKPGDSARIHARSEVKITDGSKIGTSVDGVKICQTTKVLDKTETTLKLGQYEHLFHIKWSPVVFTFVSIPKSQKAKGGDVLAAWRQKLEQTDIKLVTEFVNNATTHVLGTKRNTPQGLQVMLQGGWMVANSYADAIVTATTAQGRDANGEEVLSPLEEHYTTGWPREEEHLLPPGKEPNPRAKELLKPNAERADLFAHFNFVFLSQVQYDILMPVIATGGGKAFLIEVAICETEVHSVVSQVMAIAGKKDNVDFRLSHYTGKGGVVVVRMGEMDDPWVKDFSRSLELELEQRSIAQNEFLDIVITADTSELRKPLAPRATPGQNVNDTSATSQQVTSQQRQTARRSLEARDRDLPTPQSDQRQQKPPEKTTMAEPPPKKPKRIITQARFKGFDEVDPSQFAFDNDDDSAPSQAPSVQDMDVDDPSQPAQPVASQRSSRKRPAPDDEDIQQRERDMMDKMLPGAAAMKRLKTARAARESNREGSVQPTPDPETSTRTTTAARRTATVMAENKKKDKQVDVRAALEERRKAEDEARLKDEEALREQLAGVDISTIHAAVETYDLPQRQPPLRRSNDTGPSDRWDPAWNGRKNFKRFRPQGQRNDGPRLPRIMVTLEEVPRKAHGLGEEYWLDPPSTTISKKTKSQSQSQSQSVRQAAAAPSSEDDPNRFRRRIQDSLREDAEAASRDSFDVDFGGAFDSTPSQTLGTESQRRAAGKRPATSSLDAPVAKKARSSVKAAPVARPLVIEDDDEGDELKFRRRRR